MHWGRPAKSRDWYYKGRFVLRDEVVQHRLSFMTEIVRLLLTIIPQQRGGEIREPSSRYGASDTQLEDLLKEVPLPS